MGRTASRTSARSATPDFLQVNERSCSSSSGVSETPSSAISPCTPCARPSCPMRTLSVVMDGAPAPVLSRRFPVPRRGRAVPRRLPV